MKCQPILKNMQCGLCVIKVWKNIVHTYTYLTHLRKKLIFLVYKSSYATRIHTKVILIAVLRWLIPSKHVITTNHATTSQQKMLLNLKVMTHMMTFATHVTQLNDILTKLQMSSAECSAKLRYTND